MQSVPYRQRPLHAGYRYQDLIAAMAMADVLTDGRGEVLIETARFDGDRFDDVVFTPGGVPVATARSSIARRPAISIFRCSLPTPNDSDWTASSKASAAHPDDGAELRVVTTLRTDRTIVGAAFVAAPGLPPFAAGIGSTRWRLDADFIWPDGAAPILSVLRAVDRPALLAFCARFAIEADATPMSGSLSDPGPLERSLIARVRDDVGVEQYPNRSSAVDVASRLLEIAGALRARKQDRRVDFAAIARAAGLQVDRGRVAQAFPLDRHLYVPHVPLRRELGQATERDRRVIIEGPPGAGKSWALEAFGRDLRETRLDRGTPLLLSGAGRPRCRAAHRGRGHDRQPHLPSCSTTRGSTVRARASGARSRRSSAFCATPTSVSPPRMMASLFAWP